MIAIMDLRPGNYIHPPHVSEEEPLRYLRIVSVELIEKRIKAKADFSNEVETFSVADINGCSLESLMQYMGGLSFDDHALLIKGQGEVFIVHAEGATIALPHIRYVHQFQNLFRSLTGQELPFNLA